ncbi:hypothetical protein IF1G_11240 [Cordyceps javanica]|uniref:Uncharacterized protein n=1 Tax=Cordyceps javanica TaxID=43265 RepID=A0A545UKW4_9HYPO|nr:hypothetical protein IF1G_11240 [Cordyceps javanica]TQW01524.1 hypothetical protein IF2G_10955 [Cordyceps javanica]
MTGPLSPSQRAWLRHFLQEHPHESFVWILLRGAESANGEPEKVIDALEAMPAGDEHRRTRMQQLISNVQETTGDPAAVPEIERTMGNYPKVCRALLRQGQRGDAVRLLGQARRPVIVAKMAAEIGASLRCEPDIETAVTAWQVSLTNTPRYSRACDTLCNILAKLKDPHIPVTVWTNIITSPPASNLYAGDSLLQLAHPQLQMVLKARKDLCLSASAYKELWKYGPDQQQAAYLQIIAGTLAEVLSPENGHAFAVTLCEICYTIGQTASRHETG